MHLTKDQKTMLSSMIKRLVKESMYTLHDTRRAKRLQESELLSMIYHCHEDVFCPICGTTEMLCGYGDSGCYKEREELH